jgi:dihydroorotate dehydrogenase (NAD+) catalytic subunit
MYEGPEIFSKIADDLGKFLEENGYSNVTEIIGLSHEL